MPCHLPRPLVSALLCACAVSLHALPAMGQPPPQAAADKRDAVLSLEQALAWAGAIDPARPGDAARLAAAEAATRRAGMAPNAAVSLELENFAGTGAYSLLDRSEATLSYEQTRERGGKAQARVSRARAEVSATRLRGEIRRLDFLREVQLAYVDLLAAEAERLVADARLISAQRAQADIARRVRSARDPLFAGSRAGTATAQASIARDRAHQAVEAARGVLAGYLGRPAGFSVDLQTFFNVAPLTPPPSPSGPELALLDAEREVAAAALRVARAGARPDPTLRAGVRYFGEGSEAALLVGGSIPLGVGKTSRAEVDRAQAELSAAELDIRAAQVGSERQAARLMTRMNALAAESERIRADVIPLALRAVEQVAAGFNRGGFEYIDVTEAEAALAQARDRRVEVLRDFHKTKAELDRLTGAHRSLIANLQESR